MYVLKFRQPDGSDNIDSIVNNNSNNFIVDLPYINNSHYFIT